MLRAAILTPDPAGPWADSRWAKVLEVEAAPLRAAGFIVEGRPWTDGGSLAGFDLVLPLLAWGYPQAGERWHERVDAWEHAGVRLMNAASVLRWNADKMYLERLADLGAPVIPTLHCNRVTAQEMARAVEAFGTDRLVAKPRASSGAWQTIRWSPGSSLDDGPEGEAMIQPYLPSIESDGELSLLYLGGRFSHAIRKRPQPGDFRVQPEYRGIITAETPAADEMAAAEAVLRAAAEPLLYARIDLVRGTGGEPLLIELEAIEPDLYLEYSDEAGANFANAARSFVERGAFGAG